MRSLQTFLAEYFYYTRAERNGAVVLSVLIFLSLVVPELYPLVLPPKQEFDFSEFKMDIARVHFLDEAEEQEFQENIASRDYPEPPKRKAESFPFDPNTAGKEDFVRLGISERTAQSILNYRSKGGKFRKKEDFQKIYTLRAEDYARLEAWIKIPEAPPREERFSQSDENQAFANSEGFKKDFEERKFESKKWEPVSIDINQATAEDWQKLRGIGPGYARRIVNFREKLGGFASVEQVGETFNLPDSTFQQAKPFLLNSSPVFRKIKVNSATLEDLKMHPYLSNFQATVLLNYRQQHGAFSDLAGMKKMSAAAFKDSDWARLEPYLAFD